MAASGSSISTAICLPASACWPAWYARLSWKGTTSPSRLRRIPGTFTPSDDPNQPIGTARGINPGRVAWAYDLSACNWDGKSNYWFSKANNDQAKITAMMNKVICSVAGKPSVKLAWDALFRDKNGGTPYVKGEKIAVKLNLNNGGKYSNQIDASPQSVYALLDGLVNQFGVDQKDIVLCDPARENQCSVVADYCRPEFPGVNYDKNLGGFDAQCVLVLRPRTDRDIDVDGDRQLEVPHHDGDLETPLYALRDLRNGRGRLWKRLGHDDLQELLGDHREQSRCRGTSSSTTGTTR